MLEEKSNSEIEVCIRTSAIDAYNLCIKLGVQPSVQSGELKNLSKKEQFDGQEISYTLYTHIRIYLTNSASIMLFVEYTDHDEWQELWQNKFKEINKTSQCI